MGWSLKLIAQEQTISMRMSSRQVKMGEIFSISINIQNNESWDSGDFPEINGFIKTGKSVSHSSIVKNGTRIPQHTIKQSYLPKAPGFYSIKKSDITINGKTYIIEEYQLSVLTDETKLPVDEAINLPPENIKDDIFLFLMVDKKSFYQGEGIYTNLAVYVSENNTSNFTFPNDIGTELLKISQKLKPENSLADEKKIDEIKAESAVIRNKNYVKYTLNEAIFYPLKSGNITFPAIKLNLLKNKKLKDSTSFTTVTLSSLAYTVKLLELPEHPLKNKVPVGRFTIENLFQKKKVETGKILLVPIKISGKGNFNTLNIDTPTPNMFFDFYNPAVAWQAADKGYGTKTFNFKVFPKDSGQYDLGNYFSLIFFNVDNGKYDTLKASKVLDVFGEKIETSAANYDDIYKNIEQLSTEKSEINFRRILKIAANILLILMLAGMLFIFDFKFKSK